MHANKLSRTHVKRKLYISGLKAPFFITNIFYRYKLVITIQDDNEEMNCVLFNTDATLLLGHTVDELITKSIKEVSYLLVYTFN